MPTLPDESRNATNFSPNSIKRIGSPSDTSSDDRQAGIQNSRNRFPIGVPRPTRVSSSFSSAEIIFIPHLVQGSFALRSADPDASQCVDGFSDNRNRLVGMNHRRVEKPVRGVANRGRVKRAVHIPPRARQRICDPNIGARLPEALEVYLRRYAKRFPGAIFKGQRATSIIQDMRSSALNASIFRETDAIGYIRTDDIDHIFRGPRHLGCFLRRAFFFVRGVQNYFGPPHHEDSRDLGNCDLATGHHCKASEFGIDDWKRPIETFLGEVGIHEIVRRRPDGGIDAPKTQDDVPVGTEEKARIEKTARPLRIDFELITGDENGLAAGKLLQTARNRPGYRRARFFDPLINGLAVGRPLHRKLWKHDKLRLRDGNSARLIDQLYGSRDIAI